MERVRPSCLSVPGVHDSRIVRLQVAPANKRHDTEGSRVFLLLLVQ